MLSKLVFVTAAATLLLPSAAEACCGPSFTGKQLAALGVVAVILSPVLIPYGIIHGSVVLGASAVRGIKEKLSADRQGSEATQKQTAYWRERSNSAQVKEFFEKADKDPTPNSLFTCGLHFMLAGDVCGARMYLRRAIELARKDENWERDEKLLLFVIFATYNLGLAKFKSQRYDQALVHFQEAHQLITKHFGVFDRDAKTTQLDDAVLDAAEIEREMSWARLHRALYDVDDFLNANGENDDSLRAKDLNQAVSELQAQAATFAKNVNDASATNDAISDKYIAQLRAAVGLFYQKANEHCYWWGVERPETEDDADGNKLRQRLVADQDARAKVFSEQVIPAFQSIISAVEDSGLGKRQMDLQDFRYVAGWAHYYLARSYYVVHDKSAARNQLSLCECFLDKSDIAFDPSEVENYITSLQNFSGEVKTQLGPSYMEFIANAALPVHYATTDLSNLTSQAQPHLWEAKKMHRPTTCAKCMKWLSGKDKDEAFICTCCGYRAHKSCKEALGDDAPCLARSGEAILAGHQHVLRKKTLHRITFCTFCTRLIKNPANALKCESCSSVVVHADSCAPQMRNVIIAEEGK